MANAAAQPQAVGFLYPGFSAEDDYPRLERILSDVGTDVRLPLVHTDIGEDAHRADALLEMGSAKRLAAKVEEVKEHTRVELLPLDQVQLAGRAAADVMHLLAELIENAVTFSAPGTKALVAGQPLPAGYLLEIEDQGLGMTDEQLVKVNQRLARPPDIDFALAKMLGFFVVTQLASRHGIKVQLRHSWYGGITALVLLPRHLVVNADGLAPPPPGDEAERSQESSVGPVLESI